MDQKVLYSVMGLAAMPMVQTVAQNQNWTGTTMTVAQATAVSDASTAEPTSFNIGKLAPGSYNLACQVTSKVYDVTVKVTGAKETKSQVCNNPSTTPQDVNVAFQVVDDTKDIVISFESSDKGESGSAFSFTAPTVSLSFTFSTIKTTLANNAQALANTIAGYNYAAKQEDVENAGKLKTKAENIQSSYEDYKKYKLYAEKSTIQEEIDQLAASAAAKEATYQNEQAYGRVNAAITAIKAKYNTAVAELEGALVGAAAYLLNDAKAELNEKINEKITEATQASYASYQAGTAVADETTNTALVPTETALNNIVNNWKGQATNNINAYNTLHAIVTGLQADLDAIVPASDAIAALFPKTEAQAAIDAINTKVENAKNSAAQLTLDINSDKTAAQTKISTLAGKVNAANAEYNANEATKTAIAGVQTKLNNAKTDVNAKVSKDGQYKARDYYAKYVEDVQKEITKLSEDAAAAYKVDGTGSAQTYNAGLSAKITPIEGEITAYKTNAIDAVTKYDALMTAIYGTDAEHPGYQGQLDAARAEFEPLPIYEDENYDYKTKLDLIQKRINDIKKAINTAKGKVGEEHWTAMLAIDIDAAITTDIQNLLNNKQKDQNQYDKDSLVNGITSLQTRIATFTGDATLAKLGADYAAFAAAETTINGKVTAVETDRAAIDPEAADAATKINGLNVRVANIKAEQDALEAAANAVKDRVTANTTAKTTLATNIDNLQTKIGTFKTTYKIGQDDSTLGNRGKATGAITTEVSGIETALNTLETNNNNFDPTVVTIVDMKAKAGAFTTTGDVTSQTITGLENGLYDVQIKVTTVDGKVFANASEVNGAAGVNTLNNVLVSDGTLTIGANKATGVTVEKLDYHQNDQLNVYTNVDDKPNEAPDTDGYTVKYNKLFAQENALETAAPGIKDAVKANADTKTAADQAVTDLQTAELNTLKNLENVTNGSAVSDDATAKKADPANWKVFESGLAADKSYTAKKAAIDADITAMQNAINASASEEKLATDWQNKSITVGTGDHAKTYSIAALTDRINVLKTEAEAENANWKAYKSLQDNNMPKLLPDTITVNASIMGDGAVTYYQGLKDSYITGKATILTNMQASLNARTAVSTKDGFASQIAALIEKVKVVKSDGIANKKKYDEQKAAYTETQTLWNNTYTEIAATDHSSQVQDWLDQLDAIQVTLTAATEAVEANYPLGKSVAEAKDFAAIKAAINDVKAQQSEGYNAAVAADNLAAHESFMGNDTKKGTIQLATEAYLKAVQDRATYSSTNADIKAAVDAAAADLDIALYECPTLIEALTKQENDAYAAVVSPAVFDVDPFNTQATTIEQNITNALNQFKADVKTAIQNFWTPKKNSYDSKVSSAEAAIAAYSDAAKADAFKDVKDLIAKGTNGVNSMTLSEVEEAIAGLENIDAMLTADKNAAAVKDINLLIKAADDKYTEVKNYITGVSNNIPAKGQQLAILNNAYDDGDDSNNDVAYAKSLAKNFGNRNTVATIIGNETSGFIKKANDCKTAVENAVAADNANTEAYNDIVAAITPVEAKLAEAKAAAAPYKYATSFETDEQWLEDDKLWADWAKNNGYAVVDKTPLLTNIAALDDDINATLTTAFGIEKSGLAADIAELKNQYNAYVAANGLDATANAFKADIDDLEAQLSAIDIVDLDITNENPTGDGIQFDEIVAATKALVKLQNDIADKETELLEANASAANAEVLADFQAQLSSLKETASLEGYDEWVGQQTYGNTTLDAAITALKAQIADLEAAILAEKNISFYKDQYQAQIDAIETDLTPVAAQIAAYDDQFKANAEAYATLTTELNRLQGLVDAAKERVNGFQYYQRGDYSWTGPDYIEDYTYYGELIGGAQYDINSARNTVEGLNYYKNAQYYTLTPGSIETKIQNYLNMSANSELQLQRDNLTTLLYYAIDIKYRTNTYSNPLWTRLIDEKNGIKDDIVDLAKEIYKSYNTYEGSFNVWTYSSTSPYLVDAYYPYYYTLDANDNRISKDRTSDADYEGLMETVAAIKAEIETLSTAVDNLQLLGDANEDGRVNVLDYQKVLNMILDPTLQPLGSDTPRAKSQTEEDLFTNIDINKSGVIEVGDLTAIVNYILYQNWASGYAAVKGFESPNESLTMTSEMQQGVQRLAINLQNVEEYTAFQLDVLLPEGMTIVGSSLSDRAGQSHKLYSRNQLDGSIRLLASSVKGESFSGNEGAVLYIDVKTTSEFKGGSVELLNILFSDIYAQTRAFSVAGDATGIDTASTFESLKQKVYDLSGRVMNGMKKGVNIIQGADGTSKKVLK